MLRWIICLPLCFLGNSENREKALPKTPAAKERPARSARDLVLDAVIRDALTNPHLKGYRDWYGTPGKNTIGLDKNSDVPWPAGYVPTVAGYTFRYLDPDKNRGRKTLRRLGISLRHFSFPQPAQPPKDDLYFGSPIVICLFNLGGEKNGVTSAGTEVRYSIERVNRGWRVEAEGPFRP
jgi:hypothetical protein